MKNWLKRNIIPNIIAACAGFTLIFDVYHICTFSHFLFGEPEYPTED